MKRIKTILPEREAWEAPPSRRSQVVPGLHWDRSNSKGGFHCIGVRIVENIDTPRLPVP